MADEWRCLWCGGPWAGDRGARYGGVPSRRLYCSGRCVNDAKMARRKQHREEARELCCQFCAAPFTGTRADAKFCSPACKQRAYRQSVTTKGSGKSTRTDIRNRKGKVMSNKALSVALERDEWDRVEGSCAECSKPCYGHQGYVVRSAVWAEAGMDGWASGFLHRACLEKRLGRKLRDDELLLWPARGERGKFFLHPDYLKSPECLEHASD